MVLNWTPQVIGELFSSLIIFIAVILSFIRPETRKIKSLFFIRLGLIFAGFYFFLFMLGNLFLNTIFIINSTIMLFPTSLFFVIGVNYVMRESFNSILLIITFGAGVLLCYLAVQPNVVGFDNNYEYLSINTTGLFNLVELLLLFIFIFITFYWGLKTWLNAPVLIRREALIFIMGVVIGSPIGLLAYLLYYLNPTFFIFSDIATSLGILTICGAIFKEPKLLHILPFNIYRIVVKDNDGYPLFDHDWSESDIDDSIFTGFINAAQLMSEEVMKMGGLVNIDLTEGLLILNESELITVGLVTSKSSKLLRDALRGFSNDFEIKFQRELKKSIRDKKDYLTAYDLIEKYFSNFPYKLIKSRKQPLMLMTKYKEVPIALESKLKEIFKDENKYILVKEELMNSPFGVSPSFFNLYDELKDKPDQTLKEDSK